MGWGGGMNESGLKRKSRPESPQMRKVEVIVFILGREFRPSEPRMQNSESEMAKALRGVPKLVFDSWNARKPFGPSKVDRIRSKMKRTRDTRYIYSRTGSRRQGGVPR